jgi:succinate dehydrogenase / fumarate reductase membrane anchor subunit
MKLKWDNQGIKSPLAKARGLGAAGGTEHWMAQRITAVALIPLVLWLVYSIVNLIGASHAEFLAWQAMPLNAILMIALVIAALYHGFLGAQVVIEDYIHHEGFKMFKLIGTKLFFVLMGIAAIFSILKIAFGA